MTLPAVDIGIMSEHLNTHKGVINKLKMYLASVDNTNLKKIIGLHISVLRKHVKAMLSLINPDRNKDVLLPEMRMVKLQPKACNFSNFDKDIILECRATAKLMGSDNFNSTLMMKDLNVKNIHLKMSYEDISIQMLYDYLLNMNDDEFVPTVDRDMQLLTLQEYQHILDE